MASRILLLRHGRVGPHPLPYFGVSDPPLDEVGRCQAQKALRSLRYPLPTRLFSSPRLRAKETAKPFADSLQLEPVLLPDFAEVDFGEWEGKRFEELQDPVLLERWARLDPDFSFPGGESLAAFRERVERGVERLAEEPSEVVLAVTHGGVIRFALSFLLGLEPIKAFSFGIPPATLLTIDVWEGKGVLTGLQPVEEA